MPQHLLPSCWPATTKLLPLERRGQHGCRRQHIHLAAKRRGLSGSSPAWLEFRHITSSLMNKKSGTVGHSRLRRCQPLMRPKRSSTRAPLWNELRKWVGYCSGATHAKFAQAGGRWGQGKKCMSIKVFSGPPNPNNAVQDFERLLDMCAVFVVKDSISCRNSTVTGTP